MSGQRYAGKHVVITGGSSGIGRAIARAFGAEGADVWLGARRMDALKEAAREVDAAGGKGHAVALDVRDEESIAAFADAVRAGAPGVDILVNNAGVGAWGNLGEMETKRWHAVIETNLNGPFLVTHALLPLFRQRKGRRHIINVVSAAGKTGLPGAGAYAASKFGLRGWSEAIAQELAPEGIRVVSLFPGYVATELVRGSADEKDMVQPDDMARVVLDLTLVPESLFIDEVPIWPWRMYTD